MTVQMRPDDRHELLAPGSRRPRTALVAVAALLATLGLAACDDGAEDEVPPARSEGEATPPTSGAAPDATTGGAAMAPSADDEEGTAENEGGEMRDLPTSTERSEDGGTTTTTTGGSGG